jgi:hypothetical protein
MATYDVQDEAIACVNELFYRNGPTPEDIRKQDVPYVTQTIARYLQEAYMSYRGDRNDKTDEQT